MIGGGVMLTLVALRVMFSPVEVPVLFQGLISLSKELRCGKSFWRCSFLVLFTWELTISVSFDMLGVCLMVIMVLSLLNLSRMVICSYLLIECFVLGVSVRFGY